MNIVCCNSRSSNCINWHRHSVNTQPQIRIYLFLFWLVNLVHSRIFKNKLNAIVNYYGALDCVFLRHFMKRTRAHSDGNLRKVLKILIEDDSCVFQFRWFLCIEWRHGHNAFTLNNTECDGISSKRIRTHQGKIEYEVSTCAHSWVRQREGYI